jgi:hypothetical protein
MYQLYQEPLLPTTTTQSLLYNAPNRLDWVKIWAFVPGAEAT